jgi:hypothetical protein
MKASDDELPGRGLPPWWTADPTENVKNLGESIVAIVDAAMKRQDDLRDLESKHVRELMERDKSHTQQLRAAETDRINAIRSVDVAAVQQAASVQAAQQQALATQVTTVADAFRASLAATIAPIMTAIEDLRRAQYETQGQKQQVVETRDVRGEARLNTGQLISLVMMGIAVATFVILYVAKK